MMAILVAKIPVFTKAKTQRRVFQKESSDLKLKNMKNVSNTQVHTNKQM